MSYKLLEKSIKVECEMYKNEPGNDFELEYYLLENDVKDSEIKANKVYGVEIVKKLNDGSTEIERFENIYTSSEEARELIGKLAANTVTPLSLPYILEDLIGV